MNLNNLPFLLNIKQVAKILGVHPDTLRDWDNVGRLRAIRLGSRGDRRWRKEDIVEAAHKDLS